MSGAGRAVLVALLASVACGAPGGGGTDALRRRARTFSPPPALAPDPTNRVADDLAAARLGRRLFFEPALSDGAPDVSCATCHEPARAFTDGRSVAAAAGVGTRNSPTVLDTAHDRWLFRDGRVDSLWAQAIQPLEDPVEMAGSRVGLVRRLRGDAALADAWRAALGDALDDPALADLDDPLPHVRARDALPDATRAAVDRVVADTGKALAAYQRRLLTGPSPFDAWAAGDDAALSPSAVRGFAVFAGKARCTRCHFGPRFTDESFHNLGVPPLGGGAPRDPGRYRGAPRLLADPFRADGPHSDDPAGERARRLATLRTGPDDWGAFRTPSLRNVARTAPYMHAGQFATLRDVVRFYATLEGAVGAGHHGESTLEPVDLTERQVDDLVAFLGSLTGEDPPAEWTTPPEE